MEGKNAKATAMRVFSLERNFIVKCIRNNQKDYHRNAHKKFKLNLATGSLDIVLAMILFFEKPISESKTHNCI